MPPRVQVCPQCGQRWARRDARFCGVCGALLADAPSPPPNARRVRLLTRLGVGVAAAGLLAAATTLDLALPNRALDATVTLDDEPPLSPNPLSDDEVAALRGQADPDRLRCEPRGCELWRFDISSIGVQHPGAGVVALDDDMLLIHAGFHGFDRARLEGDDTTDDRPSHGHLLAAVDPATGRLHWERLIAGGATSGDGPAPVHLAPGPHGALVLTGTTITSLDEDGEVVWDWHLDSADESTHEVWAAFQTDDVLVFQSWRRGTGGADRSLIGLHPDTGRLLWEEGGSAAAVFHDGTAVVVDDERRMRRLDPATGETIWEGPTGQVDWVTRAGDWLVASGLDGRQLIVHLETGAEVGRVPGDPVTEPVEAGSGLLLITRPTGDDDRGEGAIEAAAALRLYHIGGDGSIAWSVELGTFEPWWECCRIRVDGEVAAVTSPDEQREFDLADGELRTIGPPPDGALAPAPVRHAPWQEVAGGVEIRWDAPGRSVGMRSDDGEVTISSGQYLSLASVDPLIVTDGEELLAVRVPGD